MVRIKLNTIYSLLANSSVFVELNIGIKKVTQLSRKLHNIYDFIVLIIKTIHLLMIFKYCVTAFFKYWNKLKNKSWVVFQFVMRNG